MSCFNKPLNCIFYFRENNVRILKVMDISESNGSALGRYLRSYFSEAPYPTAESPYPQPSRHIQSRGAISHSRVAKSTQVAISESSYPTGRDIRVAISQKALQQHQEGALSKRLRSSHRSLSLSLSLTSFLLYANCDVNFHLLTKMLMYMSPATLYKHKKTLAYQNNQIRSKILTKFVAYAYFCSNASVFVDFGYN